MNLRRFRPVRAAALGIAALTLASNAVAVPGDENWDTNWALRGANAEVFAVVEYAGELVVAGSFTAIGDVPALGIAAWDGSAWHPLGQGLTGDVECAVVWNGDLYVGGFFDLADGTPTGGLAKWDGSTWTPEIGGGTDGYVSDLAVYANDLVVMGDFTEVDGGTSVGGIASWDGSTWDTMDGGTFEYFTAVTADANYLYVVGEFTDVGGVYAENIARWNGSSWSALGFSGGLTDDFGDPFGAYAEDVYAWNGLVAVCGQFLQAGGNSLENFAVWNGSSWGTLGSAPFSGGAFAIGSFSGGLVVTDDFGYASLWNGLFWNLIGFGGYIGSIGSYGSDLAVGGLFRSMGSAHAKNVALYDGSQWHELATGDGVDGSLDAVHEWNGMLIAAGGGNTRFGNVTGSIVAAWDGTQWTNLGGGVTGNFLPYTVDLVTHDGDLVINGSFDFADGAPVPDCARWDGTSWTGVGNSMFDGGIDLEVIGSDLYGIAYLPAASVSRLDEGSNTWVALGVITGTPSAFSCLGQYGGQLLAAGGFSEISGVTAKGIALYNGTTWEPLGAGIVGNVNAMAEIGGNLYVAGGFTQAGGAPALNAAVWDGTSWSPLGSGFTFRAFDALAFGGDFFVTGEMTSAGGNPANYIARWTGTAWEALGSGFDQEGHGLAIWNGKLVAGGDFTSAGGNYSSSIATWSEGAASDAPVVAGTATFLEAPSPNPCVESTRVAFTLERSAAARLEIVNVAGRRVLTRPLGRLDAGRHTVSWDTEDAQGARVAPGVYFVTLRTTAGSATRRVTVLR